MVNKQIFAISLLLLVYILNVNAVNCNQKFYLFNLEYKDGNITYLGKTIEKGCLTGNNNFGYYKLDIAKDGQVMYSYSFDPQIRYTDVIDNGELVGGPKLVNKVNFSIPAPLIDYQEIKILKGNDEIFSITRQETESNKVEQFSLLGWVNDLIKNALGILKNT